VELIRRTLGEEAHAVTLPLVTTASGTKFGKTEAGAVWLDPTLTSPYRFYQFWINADDRDVGRYLRFFSLLGREEIEVLERSVAEQPEAREAQRALAADVTARVHGADAMRIAADASRIVFDREADPRLFAPGVLEALMQELPSVVIDLQSAAAGPAGGVVTVTAPDGRTVPVGVRRTADGAGIDVPDVFVATALVKSKGEARRLLQQGGLYVNGDKLASDVTTLPRSGAIHGAYYVLRKGARDIAIVKVIGS
jgi:tyrosyl-tRNA synthetase